MLALACAICLAVGAAPPASAPTLQPALLPPALTAIEQQMAQVRVSTETISIRENTVDHGGNTAIVLTLGHEGLSASTMLETGEIRVSPAEGALVASLGRQSIATREIGASTYVHVAPLARIDGGRPWVIEHPPRSATPQGDPTLAPQSAGGGFSALATLLDDALSVRDVGATSLDGVAVDHFSAMLAPGELPGLTRPARAEQPTVELDVFLAPSGLPLRTVTTLRCPGFTNTSTTGILAVGTPLAKVHKPPTSQTIGVRALSKIPAQPLR
jgi:hypothetical protein